MRYALPILVIAIIAEMFGLNGSHGATIVADVAFVLFFAIALVAVFMACIGASQNTILSGIFHQPETLEDKTFKEKITLPFGHRRGPEGATKKIRSSPSNGEKPAQ